jgi:hypothetical protein
MVPLEPKHGSADAVNTIIQAITSGFPERKSGAVEINAHAGWLTPVNLVHTRGTTSLYRLCPHAGAGEHLSPAAWGVTACDAAVRALAFRNLGRCYFSPSDPFLRYIAHETIREQNESRKAITRDGVVLAFKAS